MEAGLQIRYLWHDTDLVEVTISASNGEFSGSARAYIDEEDPEKAAATLEGFPRTPGDTRELRFGNMDPTFAGGGASLRFLCKDSRGNAVVEIRIAGEEERDPTDGVGRHSPCISLGTSRPR